MGRVAWLVIAAAFVLSVAPAGAHTGQPIGTAPVDVPTGALVDAPTAAPTALHADAVRPSSLVIVLVLLASVAAIRSSRRLAMALIVVLVVVTADGALHSVHHLNDVGTGAQCALAWCFTQTLAVISASVAVVTGLDAAPDPAIERTHARPDLAVARPDRGRAPPSSAA